ncbi:MAG: DM13 domain-containing protein [Leptolyngbyaceae cyanobacterium]
MQRFAIATAIFATLGIGAITIASTNAAASSAVNSAIATVNLLPQFGAQHDGEITPLPLAEARTEATEDGLFIPVEHAVSGQAYIETVGEETYLVLDEAFSTDSGPDLKIVLYKGEATEGGDVPNQIAEDSYVTLAPIESFTGEQRYLIPVGINVDDYWAVSIWCRAFNVTFSYASL